MPKTDDRDAVAWYVVASRPKREADAAAVLWHQGYAVFLPRQWETRSENGYTKSELVPLFPGYLFAAVDHHEEGQSVYAINTAEDEHGVVLQRVVRLGGSPAKIQDEILWTLRSYFDPRGDEPPSKRTMKHLRKVIRRKMLALRIEDIIAKIEVIDDNGRHRLHAYTDARGTRLA
jgi:hypothetical protein